MWHLSIVHFLCAMIHGTSTSIIAGTVIAELTCTGGVQVIKINKTIATRISREFHEN